MPAPIRRALACLFLITLAACGGGGGGDGAPAPGTPATPTPSKVWVGDRANAAIGSSPNSNPASGPLLVDRIIAGSNTQLTTSLFDFAFDPVRDRLYVADSRRILMFPNASFATGNIVPREVTTIPSSQGSFNGGVHLDATGNRLYAGTNFVGPTQTIQVFDNVSEARFAPPDRSITFSASRILDIAVDVGRDILYVYASDISGGAFTQVLAFDDASKILGTVVPDRILAINDSGGSGPIGMFLDATNDRLYLPRVLGTISVFDLVSSPLTVAASRTINLSAPTYHVVFVELSANRLYALDANGIDIIPNASGVSGVPPVFTRALAGTSQFQAIVVRP